MFVDNAGMHHCKEAQGEREGDPKKLMFPYLFTFLWAWPKGADRQTDRQTHTHPESRTYANGVGEYLVKKATK
jgi:hypothetical protein